MSDAKFELEQAAWARMREAAAPYDRYRGDWKAAMLRDLLVLIGTNETLEIALAVAAARAGLHLRTGRLSAEQRLFAGRVRPLVSEEHADDYRPVGA